MSRITPSWHEEGRQDADVYFPMNLEAEGGKPEEYYDGFWERWAELEQAEHERG